MLVGLLFISLATIFVNVVWKWHKYTLSITISPYQHSAESLPWQILASLAINEIYLYVFSGSDLVMKSDIQNICPFAQRLSINNLMSHQDCREMINVFQNSNSITNRSPYAFAHKLNVNENNNHNYNATVITNRIVDYIFDSKYYSNCLNRDQYYLYQALILQFLPNGTYGGLHSDSVFMDNTPMPGFENVKYTAILWLNNKNIDFIGGDLQFISPNSMDIFEANCGYMVVIPTSIDYMHRIMPIITGYRYALRLSFALRTTNVKTQF